MTETDQENINTKNLITGVSPVPPDFALLRNSHEGQENIDVPADLRPSPVSQMDMQTYKMNIARALSNPDDPGISASFVRWTNAQGGREKSEQEKRDEQFFQFVLMLSIQEHLRDLDRQIEQYRQMENWYHDDAIKAMQNMQKLGEAMGDATEKIKAVDDIYDDQRKTGHLDRDKAKKLLGINGDVSDAELDQRLKKFKQDEIERRARASELYEHEKERRASDEIKEAEARKNREEREEEKRKINEQYNAKAQDFKKDTDHIWNETRAEKERELKSYVEEKGIQAAVDAATFTNDKIKANEIDAKIREISVEKVKDDERGLLDDLDADDNKSEVQKQFHAAANFKAPEQPNPDAPPPSIQKTNIVPGLNING